MFVSNHIQNTHRHARKHPKRVRNMTTAVEVFGVLQPDHKLARRINRRRARIMMGRVDAKIAKTFWPLRAGLTELNLPSHVAQRSLARQLRFDRESRR